MEEGLDRKAGQDSSNHSLQKPLSLSLQFHDIGVLASNAGRQLTHDSTAIQNPAQLETTASLSAYTTGSNPTSGKFDLVQQGNTSSSLFKTDVLLDDLPLLPPPPPPSSSVPTLPQDKPQQPENGSLTDTLTALHKIDSLLQHNTAKLETSEAIASFDYSDLDSSCLNQPPSRSSSGEEFEFRQPLPPLEMSGAKVVMDGIVQSYVCLHM